MTYNIYEEDFDPIGTNHWGTPDNLYDKWNTIYHFGKFDPCPLMAEFNGLILPWTKRVFCNPPYSDITPWLQKAYFELSWGHSDLIVLLLPNNSDVGWYQNYIEGKADIVTIPHRIKFKRAKSTARFSSILVILDRYIGGKMKAETASLRETSHLSLVSPWVEPRTKWKLLRWTDPETGEKRSQRLIHKD